MSREKSPRRLDAAPFLFRHSALLFERALALREWSSPDRLSCFVSACHGSFLSGLPFHVVTAPNVFLNTTSLTVVHSMSGTTWSYWRLVAYGFVRLSERALGAVGDSHASSMGLTSAIDTSPRNR